MLAATVYFASESCSDVNCVITNLEVAYSMMPRITKATIGVCVTGCGAVGCSLAPRGRIQTGCLIGVALMGGIIAISKSCFEFSYNASNCDQSLMQHLRHPIWWFAGIAFASPFVVSQMQQLAFPAGVTLQSRIVTYALVFAILFMLCRRVERLMANRIKRSNESDNL